MERFLFIPRWLIPNFVFVFLLFSFLSLVVFSLLSKQFLKDDYLNSNKILIRNYPKPNPSETFEKSFRGGSGNYTIAVNPSWRKTPCVLVPHWRKKNKNLKPQNNFSSFLFFFIWKIVVFLEEGRLFSFFGYLNNYWSSSGKFLKKKKWSGGNIKLINCWLQSFSTILIHLLRLHDFSKNLLPWVIVFYVGDYIENHIYHVCHDFLFLV